MQVGDEIYDRKIGFVSHCGDHRNLRRCHGARQAFIVERRQIFGRASAAAHDDDFHAAAGVEIAHSGGHFGRGGIALHLRWIDHRTGGVMPPVQDVQDVAQRGRLRRSNDANSRGQRRNRLLPIGGK